MHGQLQLSLRVALLHFSGNVHQPLLSSLAGADFLQYVDPPVANDQDRLDLQDGAQQGLRSADATAFLQVFQSIDGKQHSHAVLDGIHPGQDLRLAFTGPERPCAFHRHKTQTHPAAFRIEHFDVAV